jgi:hypothetical protein
MRRSAPLARIVYFASVFMLVAVSALAEETRYP